MVIKDNTLKRTTDTALADKLWMEFYTEKGWGWLGVQSGSMLPLIHPGDKVLISRVTAEHIGGGDIIVFRRGGDMVAHRILGKRRTDEGSLFIEKGDNSPARGRFSADKVIGRVTMGKGNGRLYSLDSPLSQLTSRALSVWFYGTTVIIGRLELVMGRRAGRVLYSLSLPASNVLVRVCSIVWYIAGLRAKRRAWSGREEGQGVGDAVSTREYKI